MSKVRNTEIYHGSKLQDTEGTDEKEIETARLLLRPLTINDAQDMFEWVSDPIVNRYMPYSVYHDVEKVKEYIASLEEDANEFAFCLKDTGKVIGAGGISFTPERNAYELGYNLNRKYWGKGYATEAAKALIRWAHDELGAMNFAQITPTRILHPAMY